MIWPPMHLIAHAEMTPSGCRRFPRGDPRASRPVRQERRRDVAVRNEADARAGLADLLDLLLVARPVEHDHHHVADVARALLRDRLDDLAERAIQVEHVRERRRGGHLLHVDGGARVEHRAALRQRDHRQRVREAHRGQLGALERIDGDVDLRRRAVADLLAVVEHRRLVLLALADHHDAVHRDVVQREPHRVHGRLVRRVLLPLADPARGGQRAVLRHAHELHRDIAVGDRGLVLARDQVELALRRARLHRYRVPGGLRARSPSAWRMMPPAQIIAEPIRPTK